MSYKEVDANIWNFKDDIKVITTNGNTNKKGEAVMGRGLALQASRKFASLSKDLESILLAAKEMRTDGNKCYYFPKIKIITFPTKHNWNEKSNIELIKESMYELRKICVESNIKRIVMPRVGCNNGQLSWLDVRREIKDFLNVDDIEYIITRI